MSNKNTTIVMKVKIWRNSITQEWHSEISPDFDTIPIARELGHSVINVKTKNLQDENKEVLLYNTINEFINCIHEFRKNS